MEHEIEEAEESWPSRTRLPILSASYIPYVEFSKDRTVDELFSLQNSLSVSEMGIINKTTLQIFYSIASVLQTQIRKDITNTSGIHFREYPIFDVPFPSLTPSQGGDFKNVADIGNDIRELELVDNCQLIETGKVPYFYSIFRFLVHLYSQTKYSTECNIMALVYINRFTTRCYTASTVHNWRSMWLVAIIIAQKVWYQHKPIRSVGFSKIFSDLSTRDIRQMEYDFLVGISYTTGVHPTVYSKYYLDLYQLFRDLMKQSQPPAQEWLWENLSDCTRSLLMVKYEEEMKKRRLLIEGEANGDDYNDDALTFETRK